jgi:hypothetical protein
VHVDGQRKFLLLRGNKVKHVESNTNVVPITPQKILRPIIIIIKLIRSQNNIWITNHPSGEGNDVS